MSLSLNGTDGVTFNDGSEQWAAASPIGTKNLIINGDMNIAQRGTSSTGVTSGGYYTVDRMRVGGGVLGTWTVSQDTDVPSGQGFSNSMKLSCTTTSSLGASDTFLINQYLEGQNLQHIKKGTSSAESLTASFWVKTNKTGTYVLELRDNDNSRTINKTFTIDAADTWEKKTLTFDGDTTGILDNDNARSFDFNIWLTAGTDYTSGTLQTTWGTQTNANRAVGLTVNLADSTSNYINITGVQLEVGDTATPFEHRPYDMELARCKRYYQVYENMKLHGTVATSPTTRANRMATILPVELRATPTLTITQTGSTDHFKVYDGGASQIYSSVAANYSSNTQIELDVNLAGALTGRSPTCIFTHASGTYTSDFKLDAEL